MKTLTSISIILAMMGLVLVIAILSVKKKKDEKKI